jgi:predicted porin
LPENCRKIESKTGQKAMSRLRSTHQLSIPSSTRASRLAALAFVGLLLIPMPAGAWQEIPPSSSASSSATPEDNSASARTQPNPSASTGPDSLVLPPNTAKPSRVTALAGSLSSLSDADLKLNYFTPRLGGFQGAAGTASQTALSGSAVRRSVVKTGPSSAAPSPIIVFSGSFEKEFSGLALSLSADYGTSSLGNNRPSPAPFAAPSFVTSDPQRYSFGAAVGYSSFTLAGSFAKSRNFSALNPGGSSLSATLANPVALSALAGERQNTNWDAGLSYETGAWKFAAAYGEARQELAGVKDALRQKAAELGVNYELGSGISLGLVGVWQDLYAKAPSGKDTDKSNGTAVVIETGVEF